MHTPSPSHPVAQPSRLRRFAFAAFFTLLPALLCAENHRPTVGYIPDQRIITGDFAPQTFKIGDDSTGVNSLAVTVASSDTGWMTLGAGNITRSGSDITISFPSVGNGSATITITVTDNGTPARSVRTAFTLQKAATDSGITLQRIPNWNMPVNGTYDAITWIVNDSGAVEDALEFSWTSDNTTLLPESSGTVTIAGGTGRGRTFKVTPAAGVIGHATVTVTATNANGNVDRSTSTAFVLEVVGGGNATPPAIGNDAPFFLPTYHKQTTTGATTVSFSVSDIETPATELRVTASSSNQAVVLDSALVTGGTGGTRNVQITPVTGAMGASTITLQISDGTLTRQKQFLYVQYDPTAPINNFARSSGVYILDTSSGTTYPSSITTPYGANPPNRDGSMADITQATGYALRVSWDQVEDANTPGLYEFDLIDNALDMLESHQSNPDQKLSIILRPPEPAYVVANTTGFTWFDVEAGTDRCVPWDPYLLSRYQAFIEAMAGHQVFDAAKGMMVPLALHSRLAIINTCLAGAAGGIHDPDPQNGIVFSMMDGYSRENLRDAMRANLIYCQDNFPGKVVQFGFWKVAESDDSDMWNWVRTELLAEFNDSIRPRVGLFMDNLASTKTIPTAGSYTATPSTDFGAALYASRATTWSSFQMLASWTKPFQDNHAIKTVTGTPHEAMEYAYSPDVFNSRYTEVYGDDTVNPAFVPMLQGWRDFLASIAAPADFVALPVSPTRVDLSWQAVAGTTSYTVHRRTVGGTFALLDSTAGTTYSDTTAEPNTEYHYRVRATQPNRTAFSASYPAVTGLLRDGFELDNFTQWAATDWDRATTPAPHTGTRSAHAGPSDTNLTSDPINLTGYSSVTIDFWYMDDDINANDDINLQLSPNGTTFNNRFELDRPTGSEDVWTHKTITLNNSGADAQYFTSSFRIRFAAGSLDPNGGGALAENLWIDDVVITAE